MQLLTKLHRQLNWLARFVNRDGLSQGVHHHLTRLAAGKMFLQVTAHNRIDGAVDVIAQLLQEFLALHNSGANGRSERSEPGVKEKLQKSCV